MKITKKSFFFLFTVCLFSSCISNKDIAYLQFDEISQTDITNNYTTVFKPDDLLQIFISSDNIEATKSFNLPSAIFSNTSNSVFGQPQQLPYLVDNNGYINFPEFGKIRVAGLTRNELIEILKNKLSPDYVINPIINIVITNFTINVFGDVQKPGSYKIPDERVTILDALSLAGDLNISGKRKNVKVIREENNVKKEYILDLTSKKIFSSPAFYLQQNDNIYVEHNYARIQSASSNTSASLFISVTGLLITIVSLITR